MKKTITIIGGGISGLAILHYLAQKFQLQPKVEIKLYEKNQYLGGTIRSIYKNGFLFETGPNGFLDSKPRTLSLIKELNLEDSLCPANEDSKRRFINQRGNLKAFPAGPKDFIFSTILTPFQRLRVLSELFIPKGNNDMESVYAFGARRLGAGFAQNYLDPMVSGIYGGDAKETSLKAAFPRIAELENQYGSLFKAMGKLRNKGGHQNNINAGFPKGNLTSFKKGMEQVINTIVERYYDKIYLNNEIKTVKPYKTQFLIASQTQEELADEVYICTPAYVASAFFEESDNRFSAALGQFYYAPIAVVGLGYKRSDFLNPPVGFGYLIPSSEGKKALGVLLDSNIFHERSPQGALLLRVLIGGARFPDILKHSQEELIVLAIKEIESTYKTKVKPYEIFCQTWEQAIPQYDSRYFDNKARVDECVSHYPGLHLTANYLNGVSFNDCVENAFQSVEQSTLLKSLSYLINQLK